MRNWRKQRNLAAATLLGFLGIFVLTGFWIFVLKKENQEIRQRLDNEIQQGIAGEVFRLHVIANSDKALDQELKIQVKTEVVKYLEELLGEETTLEETKEAVLMYLPEIEKRAEKIIKQKGFDYPVHASVEKTYFPEKTYGDCTFPAGEYEALNVRIGEAKGRNWWCVLYPGLCFIDDTYGIVTDEKKAELKTVLTEAEFEEIMGNSQRKRKVRIGFRWF